MVGSSRPGVWEMMTLEEGWNRYVDALCELALSNHVHALAHPDLAKIFGRRPEPTVLAGLHERIAFAVAAAGVAIEISTAGLRKPVGELYPDPGLLEACARTGTPVTFASDAHEPDLVGESFDQARALAKATGCRTMAVFEGGLLRQEPLE